MPPHHLDVAPTHFPCARQPLERLVHRFLRRQADRQRLSGPLESKHVLSLGVGEEASEQPITPTVQQPFGLLDIDQIHTEPDHGQGRLQYQSVSGRRKPGTGR